MRILFPGSRKDASVVVHHRLTVCLTIGLAALCGMLGLTACLPDEFVTALPLPSTPEPIATDWEPAFPSLDRPYLGIYTVFPEDMQRVAEAGVSVVAVPPGTVEEMEQYLVAARSAGLRVRISLSPSFLDLDQERVERYLDALAADETIIMWYLPEEPKTTEDHERWKRLYELVTSRDPLHRPVGLYLARGATVDYFQTWADTCDIFMMGAYPEYYDIPRAALFTRVKNASLVAAENGMLTVAVPQFFDYDSILALSGEGDAEDSRLHSGHPGAVEFRADAYTGWIAGASGLDWYSLKHAAAFPDLWESMRAVAAELNELGPVLVEGKPGPQVGLQILDGPATVPSFTSLAEAPIQVRTYAYLDSLYVLAVNLADVSVEARFDGLPPSVDRLDVAFEGRSLPIDNGSMQDTFLPHAVHVYHSAQ